MKTDHRAVEPAPASADLDPESCRALWLAVLDRAVRDLNSRRYQPDARRFFDSKRLERVADLAGRDEWVLTMRRLAMSTPPAPPAPPALLAVPTKRPVSVSAYVPVDLVWRASTLAIAVCAKRSYVLAQAITTGLLVLEAARSSLPGPPAPASLSVSISTYVSNDVMARLDRLAPAYSKKSYVVAHALIAGMPLLEKAVVTGDSATPPAAVEPKAEGDDDHEGARVRLLADIRSIFKDKRVNRLPSEGLVEALRRSSSQPWSEFGMTQPLTKGRLARLLRPFGITTRNLYQGGRKVLKGYQLADFALAFKRYLPNAST